MSDLADQLRHVPLFESFTDGELEQLTNEAQLIELKPSDQIIKQGDTDDSVFIIISGIFEVIKIGESGEKYLLTTLREKDIFGEMSFLTGEPRSCSVISITSSTVMEIKKSEFKKFLKQKPEALLSLINLMEQRINENNSYFHQHRTE